MQSQDQVVPKDSISLRGWFELIVIDPDGKVRETRVVNNTIVNAGRAQVAGFINSAVSVTSSGVGAFRYLAIGSATSATGVTDTTMGSEFSSNGGARLVASSLTRVTTSVTNDTAQIQLTFTCSAGTLAVGEAAIFDSSSAGNMLARQPFAVINLSSGDSVQTTWKVQVS
jgi:hypothetical protein